MSIDITFVVEQIKQWHSVSEGKRKNKKSLCETFELNRDKPLFSFIGRLVPEKGADLLTESFRQSLTDHKDELNFLVLGSGMNSIEDSFRDLLSSWKRNFNCYIGYHEKLSHMIYAGSDFLLMPSRVEPCGLNQMYALRYGTIPIVCSVGGLKDTIKDFGEKGGFGIRFDQPMVHDICFSVDRALELFDDQKKFHQLQKKGMEIDHSWETSAKHYLDLYESLR